MPGMSIKLALNVPNSPGLIPVDEGLVASPVTTDVDVPMTRDDIDAATDDCDDDDADDDDHFFVDVVVDEDVVELPVRRVRDLLMLPQSAGRLASVWNTCK